MLLWIDLNWEGHSEVTNLNIHDYQLQIMLPV